MPVTHAAKDESQLRKVEHLSPTGILTGVSALAKLAAMLTLVFYGLAAMHCTLEGVPGFHFLKTCCFVDSAPPTPQDCESDGCGAVEDGKYRLEEPTEFAPQPLLLLARFAPAVEAPLPKRHTALFAASKSPPDLLNIWQLTCRTALPVRAPSPLS